MQTTFHIASTEAIDMINVYRLSQFLVYANDDTVTAVHDVL